ncbi:MAG: GCN5-related N-acetyltransferase [Bacteroidetes bacterium]|jgi:ribosomal protein S18 acetylase RimI-like enzyme|nr:GCN5-related N-acetyltransferase [Bacteroidota bacterium]
MVKIIDYKEELKEHIRILNYEWLQKYFNVEPGDVISLANPTAEIINKGGYIFYASYNEEIVGVVALLKVQGDIFELAKMAVTEKYQGLKVGKVLMEHCIAFAEKHGIKKLVLYSNRQLGPAIHLYEKCGFYEIELEPGHYERANIKMEKII